MSCVALWVVWGLALVLSCSLWAWKAFRWQPPHIKGGFIIKALYAVICQIITMILGSFPVSAVCSKAAQLDEGQAAKEWTDVEIVVAYPCVILQPMILGIPRLSHFGFTRFSSQ